jgi:type II secretory pathway pseudopilin PulG
MRQLTEIILYQIPWVRDLIDQHGILIGFSLITLLFVFVIVGFVIALILE